MDATPTELAPPASRLPAPDHVAPPPGSDNGTPPLVDGGIPRALTPLQRERLIAALVDALDYGRMAQLASFIFGRRADQIFNPRWLLTEIALKIVEQAEEQHRLVELQGQATELNPHNDLLQRWFQDTASWTASPYRGFAAFTEVDADVFFGRQAFVDRLARAADQQPVVVVTGASGSGKSSVVFAGLIPRLAHSGDWLTPLCFRPGNRPFTRLASCLVQRLESEKSQTDRLVERDKLAVRLRDKTIRLDDVLETLRGTQRPSRRLLLVVDQLEELFSPAVDDAERDAFLDVLLGAFTQSNDRPAPAVLVATMRSDCLRRAQAHPLFATVLPAARLDLPRMRREELRQVVEGPASLRGIDLTPGVSDLILEDTANQPGNLPLLEFTMTRLADLLMVGKRDQPIALLLPQVEAALVKHADDVVAKLGDDTPHLRKIFLHLVRAADGATPTRLESTREALGEEAWALVRRLADERVVVTDHDDERGVETVELAHDTLLGNWPRLQGWIAEDTVFLQWLDRLRTSLREWESHREQPEAEESLLAGPRLVFAESWLNHESRGSFLSPAQRGFIQDSIAKRDADQKAEAERRNRTTRRLGVGLIAALLLMVFAGSQWLVATEAQRAVEDAAQAGASRRLAAMAEQELDAGGASQLDLALLFGAEALGRKQTAEAHDALLRGLTTAPFLDTILNEAGAPVTGVSFSPDGALLAAGSTGDLLAPVETAEALAIWDLVTSKRLSVPLEDGIAIRSLSFGPIEDQRLLAVGTAGGDVVLFEIDQTPAVHERSRLAGRLDDAVTSITFSPRGNLLAAGSADGGIAIWDIAGGETGGSETNDQQPQPAGHQNAVTSVAFDSTGTKLASSSVDGAILLWDVATGQAAGKPLIGYTGPVWSMAYSPAADHPLLASGGADGFVTLWDPVAGIKLAYQEGHGALPVTSLTFSDDGTTLASGAMDSAVTVWSVTGAREGAIRAPSLEKRVTLTGNGVRVTTIAFASDRGLIATGAFDGAVLLWDIAQPYVIRERVDAIAAAANVAVSPDGETVAATTGRGSEVILMPVDDPSSAQQLAGHTDIPAYLAFSTDGKTLVSASAGTELIVWAVASGDEHFRCESPRDAVTTLAFADDRRFASGHANGDIALWNSATDTCENVAWHDHAAPVTTMAFHASQDPSGDILATGDRDGTVVLRNVNDPVSSDVIRLDPASLGVVATSLAFSSDGATLVVGGDGGAIVLWDLTAGRQSDHPITHKSRVAGAWMSDDGRLLASGSVDGSVAVTNLYGLRSESLVLDVGRARIDALAIGRNEPVLVAAGPDGAFIWDLRPSSWRSLACARVSRNLSPDEWQEWQRFVGSETPVPEPMAIEPLQKTCDIYPLGVGADLRGA